MIGTYCFDVTDPVREEVLKENKGKRRIAVRLYYPGVDDKQARTADLISENVRKNLGRKAEYTLFNKRVKVYEDLKVKEGSFPLIIYSHGYGSYLESNSDLCAFLAEQGYIVAAVNHAYEAMETLYSDGSRVVFDKSLNFRVSRPMILSLIATLRLQKKECDPQEALAEFNAFQDRYYRFMYERVREWAADDLLALSRIKEMNEDQDSSFYQKFDLSKGIGATGHSFGGATAYYHCLYDDEFSCGVNMDGGLFGDFGESVNHRPFMQLSTHDNRNVVSRIYLYHDKPVHYLIFKDMKHNGFTDMKLLLNKPGFVGKADAETALDTINEAHGAFFDRYLKQGKSEDASCLTVNTAALEDYLVL